MAIENQSEDAGLAHGEMISCKACHKEIHRTASMCPHCGAQTRTSRYKSKTVAALFAFFLGGFGGHRFYLGQWWGVFYLLFFWLWIPGLIALGEFIYFLMCDSRKWDEKYNEGIPSGPDDKSSGAIIVLFIVFGGFILVAFLGILAAVAIPAYQDYTVRARLAESHASASLVMQAVESYDSGNRQWPATISEVDITDEVLTTFVDSIAVDNGVIYVTPSPDVGVEGAVIYVPSQTQEGIAWSCKESTVASRYLPQKCRQ